VTKKINMIIIKVKGGLGNQLFQYAFGRQLSLNNNCKLILDISDYNFNKGFRKFHLQEFSIDCELISNKCIFNNINNRFIFNSRFFKENKVSLFNERLLFITNGYFDGYWQSDKYFTEIRNLLLMELTPKVLNNKILKIIKLFDRNSVSVHIRKSDYLTKENSRIYAEVTSKYYFNSMNYILSINPNSKFFIFSDDFKWVKDNLDFSNFNFEFIFESSIDDLYLMSNCQNNIIANSSFSWWGAWLNNNYDKIVIAPKFWFTKASGINDEIVPGNWIKFCN